MAKKGYQRRYTKVPDEEKSTLLNYNFRGSMGGMIEDRVRLQNWAVFLSSYTFFLPEG
jgi:hypothetical protein